MSSKKLWSLAKKRRIMCEVNFGRFLGIKKAEAKTRKEEILPPLDDPKLVAFQRWQKKGSWRMKAKKMLLFPFLFLHLEKDLLLGTACSRRRRQRIRRWWKWTTVDGEGLRRGWKKAEVRLLKHKQKKNKFKKFPVVGRKCNRKECNNWITAEKHEGKAQEISLASLSSLTTFWRGTPKKRWRARNKSS